MLLAEHYVLYHPGEPMCPVCAACRGIKRVEATVEAVMAHIEEQHPR